MTVIRLCGNLSDVSHKRSIMEIMSYIVITDIKYNLSSILMINDKVYTFQNVTRFVIVFSDFSPVIFKKWPFEIFLNGYRSQKKKIYKNEYV